MSEALREVPLASAFPIRVRMLGMMAEGRSCCELPDRGVPVASGEEDLRLRFEHYSGMGQAKISCRVGKLKDTGLVCEERRGRWSFYSLDQEAVRRLLKGTAGQLGGSHAYRHEERLKSRLMPGICGARLRL